ncbi:proline hydroxylase [Zavarzinia aquatilis]|uniref:Proline hydroxylase n=2 Tax=Zavarzinia aquatilis TaxID=2211142 RepID=A0A317EIC0_9PROT|nr:proline hydroxylase [Zavarzinia aquatilis]
MTNGQTVDLGVDWDIARAAIDEVGHAVVPAVLSAGQCQALAALYDRPDGFRSTVVMAHHGFGRGEYRYFAYPLPGLVEDLRRSLYPGLAAIATIWGRRLGRDDGWPAEHQELLSLCRDAGQSRPTPLLLSYGVGDYNCLHQDLYGPVHFPLQAAILLDAPGRDFTGGEFTLVQSRPRQQSCCEVVSLGQGDMVIFPVREYPRAGRRGWYRAQMRHGVSRLLSGRRRVLGIIFHDAR